MEGNLVALSDELARAVDITAAGVVAVNARPRMASSGVLWRPGVVVAAQHAVKRDQDITVLIEDGRRVPATLAGRDAGTDLAVLKLDTSDTAAAANAASPAVRAGQLVLAVGRAWETGVHATMGIISAVHGSWRTWQGGSIGQYVRLDVSLHPGSSGSAVVNASGQVIGIATSGLTRFAGVCIPSSTVNRVVDELLEKGHVSRAYLGVGLQPVAIPERLAKALALEQSGGLMVLSVEPGGPADEAGILLGDVLTALNGKSVTDTDDVRTALDAEPLGTRIEAAVIRAGARMTISVTLGERPRRSR